MVSVMPTLCDFFSHHWVGRRLVDIIVAFITAVATLGIYWGMVDVDSPITRIERNIVGVPDNVVYVGSDIIVHNLVCSTRGVMQTRITRTLVDGVVYLLPERNQDNKFIPAGCNEFKRTIHIPNNLPPGHYHQHTEVEVRINPLRVVSFEAPDIPIEVRRPPNWEAGSTPENH